MSALDKTVAAGSEASEEMLRVIGKKINLSDRDWVPIYRNMAW